MTNGTEAPPTILTQQLAAKTGVSESQARTILSALFNPHDGIIVNGLQDTESMRVLGVTMRLPAQ